MLINDVVVEAVRIQEMGEEDALKIIDLLAKHFEWQGGIANRERYSEFFLKRKLTDEEWNKVKKTNTFTNLDDLLEGIIMTSYRKALIETKIIDN